MSRQQDRESSLWGSFFKLGAAAAVGAAAAAAVYYATSTEPETPRAHSSRNLDPLRERREERQRREGRQRQDERRSQKNTKLATNAERVSEMQEGFQAGTVECGICLQPIDALSEIWSCSECYTSHHLLCTINWAEENKYKGTNVWECPMCRQEYPISTTDFSYRCFCGRMLNPPQIPGKTPHACDDVCGRDHNCVLKCHPGPCVY